MEVTRKIRMSVVLEDLSTWVDACSEAGWHVEDTGERITTEDAMDGEAVVVVTVPARGTPAARAELAAVQR